MTTTFRRVGPTDRELIESLIRDFHVEHGDPIDPATLARALDAICGQYELIPTWLVELDSEPVGYVALAMGYSIEVGGGDCYIDDLYIRPHARGQGLGRAALAYAEDQAARRGARRVCLEVVRGNAAASRLYHRLGFAGQDRELLFKRLGSDQPRG